MISVAIDGPSGAGKSSIAKMVARELGFIYVDTGAMYRSIALFVLNSNVSTTDEKAVEKLLPEINIDIKFSEENGQEIFLNGENVTSKIREPQMSMAASNVSAMEAVRDFLFNLQRESARKYNTIMDGRDIGTVVLPNADVKIYLTATSQERAKRRYIDFIENENEIDYATVLEDIEKRDYNDIHRDIAPLKKAKDAILVDTTTLSIEDTKNRIIEIIKEKL
ncbi:MAG: (d)CMP kinase [Oscillospiraceae bacterium]